MLPLARRVLVTLLLGAAGCSARPVGDDAANDGSGDGTAASPETGNPGASQGMPETTGALDGSTSAPAPETTAGLAPPEAPALALALAPIKRFDFTWAPAVGADHYRLLESPAPDQPFVPLVEDLVGSSTSSIVPLHLRSGASYVLQACNDAGCTDSAPVVVDGSMVEAVGYVKGSGLELAYFGRALALSADGEVLAIGTTEGIHLLVRDAAGQWTTAQVLEASADSLALSADGSLLATDGETLWFERDTNGEWIPQDDAFSVLRAVTVSADGSTIAVGWVGSVRVLVRDPTGDWSEQAALYESEEAEYRATFGASLALSADGSTLAVGSPSTYGALGGYAHVFARDATTAWSQQAFIAAEVDTSPQGFGGSVALSADGNTLVIGASAAASLPIFERDAAGEWTQQGQVAIEYGVEKELGCSVALSSAGDVLAVGAMADASLSAGIGGDETNASASRSGATYVFVRDAGGEWSQRAYVKAPNPDWGDLFGLRVALSGDGNVLAVGAPYEDGGASGIGGDPTDDSAVAAGAVYLY